MQLRKSKSIRNVPIQWGTRIRWQYQSTNYTGIIRAVSNPLCSPARINMIVHATRDQQQLGRAWGAIQTVPNLDDIDLSVVKQMLGQNIQNVKIGLDQWVDSDDLMGK